MPVISHVEIQILVSHSKMLLISSSFPAVFQEPKPPLGGSLMSQGFEVNDCAGSWLCLRGVVMPSLSPGRTKMGREQWGSLTF